MTIPTTNTDAEAAAVRVDAPAPMAGCDIDCAGIDGEVLNRRCPCTAADVGPLRERLAALLPEPAALDPAMHANLFSPYALFVDRAVLDAIGAVASALYGIAANPGYAAHVLQWAPDIARHDPGTPGGVLGLDFHLTVEGPRLIEINTNPGGLLLNALLVDAVRSCAPAWEPWTSGARAHDAAVAVWLDEMRAQLGRMPARAAIVDTAPHAQFLYPEFALYAQAFRARGVDTVILAPEQLRDGPDGLHDADGRIDAVYNRLTDFALAEPAHAALREAYRRGAVALTPHPRAHALFADKRNLAVLGDPARLAAWGVEPSVAARFAQVVPETVALDDGNRDALWADRDRWFFKPATGYGSRGTYRGDKLTRRAWESLAAAPYVAQAIAAPGARIVHGGTALKADLRCFVSAAGVLLFAARLYQGQTTNMRTPFGGFAAVLTESGGREIVDRK